MYACMYACVRAHPWAASLHILASSVLICSRRFLILLPFPISLFSFLSFSSSSSC